jgi:hypothetical protein
MAFTTPDLQKRGRRAVSKIGTGKCWDKPEVLKEGEHELALVWIEDALNKSAAHVTLDEVLELVNSKLAD